MARRISIPLLLRRFRKVVQQTRQIETKAQSTHRVPHSFAFFANEWVLASPKFVVPTPVCQRSKGPVRLRYLNIVVLSKANSDAALRSCRQNNHGSSSLTVTSISGRL